ncbi:hypothetical protein [Crateriforma conspicua]|nr:hypothetical protein [Crateriforma conspicua]
MFLISITIKLWADSWFSTMAMSLLGAEIPESVSGSPHPAAIVPIALDGACLVSLGGFAAFHLCWGLVSDLVGLIDSFGDSPTASAVSEKQSRVNHDKFSGERSSSAGSLRSIEKRLAVLEAKAVRLDPPKPPPLAKSTEEMLAEKNTEVEYLRAKLAELQKPPRHGNSV